MTSTSELSVPPHASDTAALLTNLAEHDYERLLGYVQRVLSKYGRGDSGAIGAEDILQTYFATCLEKSWLETAEEEIRCLRAFVFDQLHKFTIRQLRYKSAGVRRPHRLMDIDLAQPADPGRRPDSRMDAEFLKRLIEDARAALRKRHPLHGEVIDDLVENAGRSSTTLQSRLGKTNGQMSALRFRARRRLQRILEQVITQHPSLRNDFSGSIRQLGALLAA